MRADLGCPGERQNDTLRFPVGYSTLDPKILVASYAGLERPSLMVRPGLGNSR
jgi:hypothetical protein